MKTLNTNLQIKKQINLMFDTFYQIGEWTRSPGAVDLDEVLLECEGVQLKLKHHAAFMAMAVQLQGQGLAKEEKAGCIRQLVRDFQTNSRETIATMDELFDELLDWMISQN